MVEIHRGEGILGFQHFGVGFQRLGAFRRITIVAITPDGKNVLSASNDNTVRVWDVNTGICLRSLGGHAGGVTAVAIAPDGKHVLSASNESTVRVWDAGTGICLRSLSGHTGGVTAVAMTPDGKHALSASNDKTVRIWDLWTGREIAVYPLESSGYSLAVISNHRFLAGTYSGQLHFLTLHNWPTE